MISYPIYFAEWQAELPYIKYYVEVTGGGARIKVDGEKGDVDNSGTPLGNLVWSLQSSAFSYSAGNDTIPLGEVPLVAGNLELVFVTDYYVNYDWANAIINLYAVHEEFDDDILIAAFRVSDVDKTKKKVNLSLDNKFMSNARVNNQIDDTMPVDGFSGNLLQTYIHVNNEVKSTFSSDSDCFNKDFNVTEIPEGTYREHLSDIAEIAGGGMLLKNSPDGFRFAPLNFKPYSALEDTEIETDKAISNVGSIVDSVGNSVTGYIPVDFSRYYIFNFGNIANQNNLWLAVYDDSKVLLATDRLSDFATSKGQGFLTPDYFGGSGQGYIRLTTFTDNLNELYFITVDHVLKNWLKLDTGFPVTPTAIKYIFSGADVPLLSNSTFLTSIDSGSTSSHAENHLSAILTSTAYASHGNKQYDRYAVVKIATNEVIAVGYDASAVTWNPSNYIILAHGTYSAWLNNSVKVGDTVIYQAASPHKITVNPTSQSYVIDMSENKIFEVSSAAEVTAAVENLTERLIGFTFYPFEGEYLNFPFVEPFDSVGIVDEKGNVFYSFAMNISTNLYGRTTISNTVKYGTTD